MDSLLPKPITPQAKAFDKNLNTTMDSHGIHENGSVISEKEELVKKIYDSGKMERLAHEDPILHAKYDELIAKKGELGTHYNENVLVMLFKDYVLTDKKNIQKYINARPIEKKRRDKTGINMVDKLVNKDKAHKEQVLATHPDSNKPEEKKVEETTGSGSSGAFVQALDNPQVKPIDESTTSSSSGQYSQPSIWASDPSKSRNAKKPMYKGGTIIQEGNYLNDAKVFEEYVQQLNESDLGFYDKMNDDFHDIHNSNNKGLGLSVEKLKPDSEQKKSDDIEDVTSLYISQDIHNMEPSDRDMLMHDMKDEHSYFPHPDNKNLSDDGIVNSVKYMGDGKVKKIENMNNENKEQEIDEVSKSKAQQRFMGLIKGIQAGTAKNASPEAKKSAAEMKPSDVSDFASSRVKNAPEHVVKEDQADFYLLRSIIKKLPLRIILADAMKLKTVEDITNYANSKDISVATLKELINFYLEENLSYAGQIQTKEQELLLHIISLIDELEPVQPETKTEPVEESSIIDDKSSEETMANKTDNSSVSGVNPDAGGIDTSSSASMMKMESIKENINKTKIMIETEELNEINKELNYITETMNVLKEDRKPSAIVLLDRLKTDNGKNFKSDFKKSDTEQTIEFQDKMQAKENDIKGKTDAVKVSGGVEVKNPHGLAEKLEDKELETTDGEALKNVGDSNIDKPKGDEIIKRNLTDSEQDEYNTLRKGQQSIVYDNDPGKKFTERTEKEMGKYFTDIKHKQYDNLAKMPQYNKDTQPIDNGNEVDQYDKYKVGYNKPVKTEAYNIAGKYIDSINKTHFINFNLSEANELGDNDVNTLLEINTAGFGNTSSNTMKINEEVAYIINNHKFYINEAKEIFFAPNKKEVIVESNNPALEKMRRLFEYNNKTFVDTKSSKVNRGF